MLTNQPYFSVMCRWGIVRWIMLRIGEYSSAAEVLAPFFEHDNFVVPEAPELSERPQLPQPIFVGQ